MSASSIEWTRGDDGSLGATWNPVRGCSRVSEGCRNCYAERMASRFYGKHEAFHGFARSINGRPQWTGKVEPIPSKLAEPLHWRKPRRVFVNSMSDLFHEALRDEAIAAVFGVMAAAPAHTFQILTKRPERMREWFRWIEQGFQGAGIGGTRLAPAGPSLRANRMPSGEWRALPWPLPNVWLGVSVEDQATADERIPLLLQTPAAKRFVSYEPALGPVNFQGAMNCPACGGDGENRDGNACGSCHTSGERDRRWLSCRHHPSGSCVCSTTLDWIIVGGESGPGARGFDVAWARSTVRQCREAGVACFVKQMGRWVLGDHQGFAVNQFLLPDGVRYVPALLPSRFRRPDDAIGFSLGDPKGGDMADWPSDLRVREFPA